MRGMVAWRGLLIAVAAIVLAAAPPLEGYAGWLSRLSHGVTDAGGAGGKGASRFGTHAFEEAAGFVARLPATAKGVAVAAHITDAGHWQFANKLGDIYTAGSAEEMARIAGVLAPGTGPLDKMSIYLSREAAFKMREAAVALPASSDIYVVLGRESYALDRTGSVDMPFRARVRENVHVPLTDEVLFEEAAFHLGRALNRSSIRVLAFEIGGSKRLDRVPRFDPKTKAPLVDTLDPSALADALGMVRGQTVLVTGRMEAGKLSVGGGTAVPLTALRAAAERADVNLVVLHTLSPAQPGGRNWLWQKIEVAGLDEAMTHATFGDFLNVLAGGKDKLLVTAERDGLGRVLITALPSGEKGAPLTGIFRDWADSLSVSVAGNLAVEGASAAVRDKNAEEERDLRLIPSIPSAVQFAYLGGLLMGLLGWAYARRWFARIWPPEDEAEYASRSGWRTASGVRFLAFFFVFLPLLGPFALIAVLLEQAWLIVTAPFRAISWLFRRRGANAG